MKLPRIISRSLLPGSCLFLAAFMTPACMQMETRSTVFGKAGTSPGFVRDIKGIMKRFCLECHGARYREAGLDLRTLRSVIKGGESGPAVVAGFPEESLLFTMMDDGHMPPEGKKPRQHTLSTVRRWIASGAQP